MAAAPGRNRRRTFVLGPQPGPARPGQRISPRSPSRPAPEGNTIPPAQPPSHPIPCPESPGDPGGRGRSPRKLKPPGNPRPKGPPCPHAPPTEPGCSPRRRPYSPHSCSRVRSQGARTAKACATRAHRPRPARQRPRPHPRCPPHRHPTRPTRPARPARTLPPPPRPTSRRRAGTRTRDGRCCRSCGTAHRRRRRPPCPAVCRWTTSAPDTSARRTPRRRP